MVLDYKMKKRWPYSKRNGSNEKKSAYWDSENVFSAGGLKITGILIFFIW
jgi:hypothetical protein